MRFLLRVALFLACIAIGSTWYLLHAEGKAFNWQNIVRIPEVHLPRLRLPDWQDLQFWKSGDDPAIAGPPGEKWVVRPGQEPSTYAPFVPVEGQAYPFPAGTYFRWQDASGIWHYSEKPHTGVRNFPVVTNPEQNILPAE